MTAPVEDLDESIGAVFDELFEVAEPLPLVTQHRDVKNWVNIFSILKFRIKGLLHAIVDYLTDQFPTRLRIGGGVGILPALRAFDFCRSLINVIDQGAAPDKAVNRLATSIQNILTREQFRHWAANMFAVQKISITKELFICWMIWMETIMRGDLPVEKAR
jgi:hypothetical protein